MVRKQVYLTADLDRRLRDEAARQRRSEAEILRKALAVHLGEDGRTPAEAASDSLWDLVGVGESQAGDLSERVDEVLYGKTISRR